MAVLAALARALQGGAPTSGASAGASVGENVGANVGPPIAFKQQGQPGDAGSLVGNAIGAPLGTAPAPVRVVDASTPAPVPTPTGPPIVMPADDKTVTNATPTGSTAPVVGDATVTNGGAIPTDPGKDADQRPDPSAPTSPDAITPSIANDPQSLLARAAQLKQQAADVRTQAAGTPAVKQHRMNDTQTALSVLATILSPDLGRGIQAGFENATERKAQGQQADRDQAMQQAEAHARELETQAGSAEQQANVGIAAARAEADRRNKIELANIQTSGKSITELEKTLQDPKANPVSQASAMRVLRLYDPARFAYTDKEIYDKENSPWIYGNIGTSVVHKNDSTADLNAAKGDEAESKAGLNDANADFVAGAKTNHVNAQTGTEKAKADYLQTRAADIKATQEPRIRGMIASAGAKATAAELNRVKAVTESWRAATAQKGYDWYDRKAGADLDATKDKALAALNDSNARVNAINAKIQGGANAPGTKGAVTAKDVYSTRNKLQDGIDKANAALGKMDTDDWNLQQRLSALDAGRTQPKTPGERADIVQQMQHNAGIRAYFGVLRDNASARIGALDKINVNQPKNAAGQAVGIDAARQDALKLIKAYPGRADAFRNKFQSLYGVPLGG